MTFPAAGPVEARLAEIAQLIAEIDARWPAGAVVPRGSETDEFNAAQDKLAEHVPPLVAALEAVLALTGHWLAEDLGTLPRRTQMRRACAESVREAIEVALRDTQGVQS